MDTPTVFISSATGTQGGALARQARGIGWEVHTTTRNPDSPAAQALSAIGVKVTPGDWDDAAALRSAMAGSLYLFLNLFPDFVDSDLELRRAKNIMAVAKEAGVKHAVYSSDFALPSNESESFIDRARTSKRNIEKEIAGVGFSTWCVIRPGFFMANFILPKVAMYPGATEGTFTFAFPADTGLPLIDHEDIAKFVTAAFKEPARFHGHMIRIAGEIVNVQDVMAAIERAAERNVRAVYLTGAEAEERAKTDLYLKAQSAAPLMAGLVDMDEVKSWGIPLGTFEEFLAREKESVAATYENAKG